MAQYLITYDNRPPRDYRALYNLMLNSRAVRLADSVWLAEVDASAETVATAVQRTLEPNDRIAVIELKVGADWRAMNISTEAARWLSDHVATAEIFFAR